MGDGEGGKSDERSSVFSDRLTVGVDAEVSPWDAAALGSLRFDFRFDLPDRDRFEPCCGEPASAEVLGCDERGAPCSICSLTSAWSIASAFVFATAFVFSPAFERLFLRDFERSDRLSSGCDERCGSRDSSRRFDPASATGGGGAAPAGGSTGGAAGTSDERDSRGFNVGIASRSIGGATGGGVGGVRVGGVGVGGVGVGGVGVGGVGVDSTEGWPGGCG